MAYIKCQFQGAPAVAPSDMPPYEPQIATVTQEVSGASWMTVASGSPSLGANNIECQFTATGTSASSTAGYGYAHLKFADVLNVSAINNLKVYASLRRQGGIDSSHPITFTVEACYRGNALASDTVTYSSASSTGTNKTFNLDLSGVNRIDEIKCTTYLHGRAATSGSFTVGIRWYQTQSNYIKFE